MSCTAAMLANLHRAFKNRCADTLARHFEKAEMRNAAHLNASPVVLEAILHLLFDSAIVALFFHVDEVDNDQTGKVAQTQLTRDFFGRFQIGLESRVFDRMFAG